MYPNHVPLLTTSEANDWASARYNQLQQNAGYQQPAAEQRPQNYYEQNQQNFFPGSIPSASATPENAYMNYNMAYNPYYAAQYPVAQPNGQHLWWQNQFIDPRIFYAYAQVYNQAYAYNYGLNYSAPQLQRRGRPKRMMAPRKPSSISSSQSSSPAPSISNSVESINLLMPQTPTLSDNLMMPATHAYSDGLLMTVPQASSETIQKSPESSEKNFSIGMKPQDRLNWIRETWSKAASTNEQSTEDDNCSWNSSWKLLAPPVKPLRRPYESSLNH